MHSDCLCRCKAGNRAPIQALFCFVLTRKAGQKPRKDTMNTFMAFLNEYAITGLVVLLIGLAVIITVKTKMLFPLMSGGTAVGAALLMGAGSDNAAILLGIALLGFLLGVVGQRLVKNPG